MIFIRPRTEATHMKEKGIGRIRKYQDMCDKQQIEGDVRSHPWRKEEEPKVLERWASYFEEFLNRAAEEEAVGNEVDESHDELERDRHLEPEPTLHEVKTSIKCMKSNKALEEDGITAELLK